MAENEFNQTNNDNATGVQGNDNTVNVNHAGKPSPAAEIFAPIIDHVESKNISWGSFESSSEAQELATTHTTPQAFLTFAQSQADEEIAASEELPADEFEKQKSKWTERFKSIAPVLLKGGLVVGSAVAQSYVSKSPLVAGLTAGFDYAKSIV